MERFLAFPREIQSMIYRNIILPCHNYHLNPGVPSSTDEGHNQWPLEKRPPIVHESTAPGTPVPDHGQHASTSNVLIAGSLPQNAWYFLSPEAYRHRRTRMNIRLASKQLHAEASAILFREATLVVYWSKHISQRLDDDLRRESDGSSKADDEALLRLLRQFDHLQILAEDRELAHLRALQCVAGARLALVRAGNRPQCVNIRVCFTHDTFPWMPPAVTQAFDALCEAIPLENTTSAAATRAAAVELSIVLEPPYCRCTHAGSCLEALVECASKLGPLAAAATATTMPHVVPLFQWANVMPEPIDLKRMDHTSERNYCCGRITKSKAGEELQEVWMAGRFVEINDSSKTMRWLMGFEQPAIGWPNWAVEQERDA